jgi:hypothetical protein
MTDLFIDGIRSIAVVNGVARLELVQMKRSPQSNKMEAAPAGTLSLPLAALKDISHQLDKAVQRLVPDGEKRAQEGRDEEISSALQNL